MLLADGNGAAIEEIVSPTIAPTTAPAIVTTPDVVKDVVADVVKESGASADVVASSGLFQSPWFWAVVAVVGLIVVIAIIRKIIQK